ncbi:MAG: carbohydrate ABC transporter permease [Oscillospiraceae bacterium]|nr:carbohydrate ABC transporter permease [Oscillospiraceae bacterium]
MNKEVVLVSDAVETNLPDSVKDKKTSLSKKKYKPEKQTFKQLLERNRESGGYLFRKTFGKWAFSIGRGLLLFGFCFLILQPLLNKISISIMAETDLYDGTVNSIPRNFTLDHYRLTAQLMDYKNALFKTFGISLAVAFFQVAACTFVGYGFARFKFPFKKFWFACVMMMILVPPQTILSSLYLHFSFFDVLGIIKLVSGKPINLLNNPTPYLLMSATCMGLKNGLYIYMIRQFFRGVPKDIEEAAYVDGCGKFKTFWRIMLPDARAIITSCFLFSFVWQWTDSLFTSLFMRDMRLLSSSVNSIAGTLRDYFQNTYGRDTVPTPGLSNQMVATGMLMFIVPLILLYLIAQKGFVESISQSGIKM